MKNFRKNIFMCMAILCVLMFLCSPAFAVKNANEEGGLDLPPKGETGDPGGTKLTGVLCIHYNNLHYGPDGVSLYEGATFALRLTREKSAIPTLFYGTWVGELDPSVVESVVDVVTSVLKLDVEETFFDGASMDFKVKSLKNLGDVDILGGLDLIVVVDVELAAKPAE